MGKPNRTGIRMYCTNKSQLISNTTCVYLQDKKYYDKLKTIRDVSTKKKRFNKEESDIKYKG